MIQTNSIQLSDSGDSRGDYTVTLGPGLVRYLSPEVFFAADVENVIALLRSLPGGLEIKPPDYPLRAWQIKLGVSSEERPNWVVFEPAEFDTLLKNETWESKLRLHHKLGWLYVSETMPSAAYCCFHELLRLKEFEFDECLKALVKQALGNDDIINSYRKSLDHIVVIYDGRRSDFEFVFARTAFVTGRLNQLMQDETERESASDLELLRRSKFDCFIYVMEDLRNKTFKIGRSKTPGKRERTLQSEMPQIVMRFSIPGEEAHEKQLHDQFDAKRVRGEWFALTNDDLLWVVDFLKTKGDAGRVIVDNSWLGSVYLASSTGRVSK